MDSVNNRSLFRRKSQAARDAVRRMGGVREPQGILASFPELMNVVMSRPARFQQGGDVAMEAFRQGMPEPSLGSQFAAIQAQSMRQPMDITATPTPRGRVEIPSVVDMVRRDLGDNEEAQAKFSEIIDTVSDPEASNEERQKVVTENFGAPNSPEGLRTVVSRITGQDVPASTTVDELNRAIAGVALGGAIGGPRSVAARISEALLTGLQAQRETAVGREQFEQQIAIAAARGTGEAPMGPEARDFRNPIDAYQAGVEAASRVSDFEIPEGMTREQFENEAGLRMVRNSYTPEQLVGTRFEGMSAPTTAAPAPAARPTLEQFLTAARQAPQNEGVSDEQLIEYYNQTYGG